jgi:5-formyltetrahydrofolate cyclo-ligase
MTPTERSHLRQKLIATRHALPDRLERSTQLQSVLRTWLVTRAESSIGAYWPIKAEFDPLPALFSWSAGGPEGQPRRIGLPVLDAVLTTLKFHVWYPGCPMAPDAHQILKPKGTDEFEPRIIVMPCLGYGPGGVRLGYGGGFFDRTMAQLQPRPLTVGVGFAHGFLPLLRARPGDAVVDVMMTENGLMWQRD